MSRVSRTQECVKNKVHFSSTPDQHNDKQHLCQECGRSQLIKDQVHFPTPLLVPGARVAQSHLVIKDDVMIVLNNIFINIIIIIISNSIALYYISLYLEGEI